MTLSMQSFCPTTARKLKTVHADFDAETHYFHLKTQASEDEFGKSETVKADLHGTTDACDKLTTGLRYDLRPFTCVRHFLLQN